MLRYNKKYYWGFKLFNNNLVVIYTSNVSLCRKWITCNKKGNHIMISSLLILITKKQNIMLMIGIKY